MIESENDKILQREPEPPELFDSCVVGSRLLMTAFI